MGETGQALQLQSSARRPAPCGRAARPADPSAGLKRFLADESGATAIEYGLIAGMIALVIVGAISALGGGNGGMWTNNSDQLTAAMGG
ncbi:MAG: Flp family type IVb pilin [Oceanicaulis sp.]